MANAYAGVYFGFKIWGELLRARMYAVQTAPTINICVDDLVSAELAGLVTAKLGLTAYVFDANVHDATPGGESLFIGAVQACFDENMDPCQYIAAAEAGDATTAGYVLVADHPGQQYMAVVDAAITAGDMDLNYPISGSALYAPNSYTYISAQYITTTGNGVGNTIPMRFVRQAYATEDTNAAGIRMICQIQPNCHLFGAGTAL